MHNTNMCNALKVIRDARWWTKINAKYKFNVHTTTNSQFRKSTAIEFAYFCLHISPLVPAEHAHRS